MAIDGQGKIVSCTGLQGPIAGYFFYESSHVAGLIETGDTAPGWEELMIMEASLTSNTSGASVLSGCFALDCGSCDYPHGTFLLEKGAKADVVRIKSFHAARVRSEIKLSWEVVSDNEIRSFKIERRLTEDNLNGQLDAVKLISSGERMHVDDEVDFDQSYLYTLLVVGNDDSELASESISIKTIAPDIVLYQNHPNPFNPTTTISFQLPRKSHVKLSIYDVTGRCIKTLANDVMDAGIKEIVWDGKDVKGNSVGAGIYFSSLKTGDKVLTRKMVLLR